MSAYAFGEGRVEGERGFRAIMKDVSLDFNQSLEQQPFAEGQVAVALGDGELRITGQCKDLSVKEGVAEKPGADFLCHYDKQFWCEEGCDDQA